MDFFSFQQFTTLDSSDILIFKFLQNLIPVTLSIKVAKKFIDFRGNFLPLKVAFYKFLGLKETNK